MARTAAFTICANNYLHTAKTLLSSISKHHPEWDLYLCLVDKIDGEASEEITFKIFEAERLPIPDRDDFFFKYDLLELCTAVKPWAFEHLITEFAYDRVVYFDPDIKLYSELTELNELYDAGSSIIFTPHLAACSGDALCYHEVNILRSGTWNLGFCAIDRSATARKFLR